MQTEERPPQHLTARPMQADLEESLLLAWQFHPSSWPTAQGREIMLSQVSSPVFLFSTPHQRRCYK